MESKKQNTSLIICLVLIMTLFHPSIKGQASIILVKPTYKVTDIANKANFQSISESFAASLKKELEVLSYKCYFQDFLNWNSFQESKKISILNANGAKYVITTKSIEIAKNTTGSDKYYIVDFMIDTLDKTTNQLVEQNWDDSKFLVKSEGRTITEAAKSVSLDLHYYFRNKEFKPRIKITASSEAALPQQFDKQDFGKWLEKLLKNNTAMYMYVFYYDDVIFPPDCENSLIYKSEETSKPDKFKLILVVELLDDEEECSSFEITIPEYLPIDSRDKLVKEIDRKLQLLIESNE